MRHALLFALFLTFVAGSASGEEPALAPDEKQIADLIKDLGSTDFNVRASASERLKQVGPEVIPMLQRFSDSDDPEIRARIRGVMRAFEWMQDGAILFSVEKTSPVAALLQPGDVIVQIDDVDIKTFTDVNPTLKNAAGLAKARVWRRGRVLQVDLPKDKVVGVGFASWSIARGGNDHSRGLAELVGDNPRHDEAYRRLKAAYASGMEDNFSMYILSALAAREHDGVFARKCYEASMASHANCNRTHYEPPPPINSLPYCGPHGQWLTKKYLEGPNTPELAHEVEDWCATKGRNRPMLREALVNPWVGDATSADQLRIHRSAKYRLAFHERRWDDAWQHWTEIGDATVTGEWGTLAIQSAVRRGDARAAAELAVRMLQGPSIDPAAKEFPEAALWGLALASATEDQAAIDIYLQHLNQLDDKQREVVAGLASVNGLWQPAAARLIRKWVGDKPRLKPTRFEEIALSSLIADPAATPAQFDAFTKAYPPAGTTGTFDVDCLTALVRFGRYADASVAVDRFAKRYVSAPPHIVLNARAAIEFGKAHAKELDGKWKDLRGFVEVLKLADRGETWVLRYDGRLFVIGKDGTARAFPAIPEPPSAVSLSGAHLRAGKGGVAVLFRYGHREFGALHPDVRAEGYFADASHMKISPISELKSPIAEQPDREMRSLMTRAAVERAHGPTADGLPRASMDIGFGYLYYEGDVLVYLGQDAREPVNLSLEIGRLAGIDGPAEVYMPNVRDRRFNLIYSNCGLWQFDTTTAKLARIRLGLDDENVITCLMPEKIYGTPADGKTAVGVAPQQGGAIVLVDPATAKVTATNGFNGLGPNDWYAAHLLWQHVNDHQSAIHAAYLERVAKKR